MRWAALIFVAALLIAGCAGLADFLAATESGAREAAPAIGLAPSAAAGNPFAWIEIGSYLGNAVLAAWATWERRRRKKEASDLERLRRKKGK